MSMVSADERARCHAAGKTLGTGDENNALTDRFAGRGREFWMGVMQRYGTALIVSGPSGAGKTTVCRRLLDQCPELHFSVSCTTRPPRLDEEHGRDYCFLSRAQFEERIGEDAFLEYAEVHGNMYGTLREEAERFVANGQDVLLDIDVQGARQLRERAQGTLLAGCAVYVFFAPPSFSELERRLRNRATDLERVVTRRLRSAEAELAAWREFEYLIVNDEVDDAVARLRSVLEASHCATAVVAVTDPIPQ